MVGIQQCAGVAYFEYIGIDTICFTRILQRKIVKAYDRRRVPHAPPSKRDPETYCAHIKSGGLSKKKKNENEQILYTIIVAVIV